MGSMKESDTAPPGQERKYPPPTKTGTISFTPPGTDLKCETFYFLWGEITKDKLPLICLHGGPGFTSRALQPFALLNQDYGIPVILYDQLGCGSSTRLPDKKGDVSFWTFELFIAELWNLIKAFGIQEYALLGQSWGGMLAARFAFTQPEGLRKLVFNSSPASCALMMQAVADQRAQAAPEVREILSRCEREGQTKSDEYQQALQPWFKQYVCRVDPFPEELTQALALSGEDDTVYTTLYGPTYMHQTGPLKDFDIIAELPQIAETTVPGGILVCHGKYDGLGYAAARPYFTEPKAKAKWVTLPQSSHLAILEETESFVAAVGAFLTRE